MRFGLSLPYRSIVNLTISLASFLSEASLPLYGTFCGQGPPKKLFIFYLSLKVASCFLRKYLVIRVMLEFITSFVSSPSVLFCLSLKSGSMALYLTLLSLYFRDGTQAHMSDDCPWSMGSWQVFLPLTWWMGTGLLAMAGRLFSPLRECLSLRLLWASRKALFLRFIVNNYIDTALPRSLGYSCPYLNILFPLAMCSSFRTVIIEYSPCLYSLFEYRHMQFDEFKFIYDDLKVQLKEIPSLPLLLKSIQKTTKKLQCLNLYSNVDKKQFDLELYENKAFEEISQILQLVARMREKSEQEELTMQGLLELEQRLEDMKEQKMEAFDSLNKMEERLQEEIDLLVDEKHMEQPKRVEDEIKEVEEDEEEAAEETVSPDLDPAKRVEALKREIEDLNRKIGKSNRGKGKWFDGDHRDFIKVFNKCGGDAKRIVVEGQKVLGMKSTQIMDHLALYENYLQWQKQKKLASQEFKSIKYLESQINNEKEYQAGIRQEQREQIRRRAKEEEQVEKRKQIEQFKRKKAEEKQQFIQMAEKDRVNQKRKSAVSTDKRKEIEERNRRMLEQKQQAFKQRNNSSSGGEAARKGRQVNVNIPNQVHTLKQIKVPKPPSKPR